MATLLLLSRFSLLVVLLLLMVFDDSLGYISKRHRRRHGSSHGGFFGLFGRSHHSSSSSHGSSDHHSDNHNSHTPVVSSPVDGHHSNHESSPPRQDVVNPDLQNSESAYRFEHPSDHSHNHNSHSPKGGRNTDENMEVTSSTSEKPITQKLESRNLYGIEEYPQDVLAKFEKVKEFLEKMQGEFLNSDSKGSKKNKEKSSQHGTLARDHDVDYSDIFSIKDDDVLNGKRRPKGSVNKYHKTPRTSCRVRLCTFTRDYPYDRINDAVNQILNILTSSNQVLKNETSRIDDEVLQYESKSINVRNNHYEEHGKDGCTVHVNVTQPLEGYSFADQKTYYIVNIPSFQQQVELLKCNSGKLCNNDLELRLATCRQTYRKEKLLVLPIDKHQFDVSDFKIKTFRVHNGCRCQLHRGVQIN